MLASPQRKLDIVCECLGNSKMENYQELVKDNKTKSIILDSHGHC